MRGDPPPDLVPVALGKGCLLLLTAMEYQRALARGKAYRRRLALAKRDAARTMRN
ncbi:MAG TPA: hypothetical protein VN203_13215 [Candidatus Acidoferrum sp.]|nr:hypothetical protein [Candidatus Acidoferrum sp.]